MDHLHNPFYLGDIFVGQLEKSGLRKSEKTRLRLLRATVDQLSPVSYQQLRIADICKKANVSYGLFYHYFKDKRVIVATIVRAYLIEFYERFDRRPADRNAYIRIFDANYYYLRCYGLNAGIMKVLVSNASEIPEMMESYTEVAFNWH